MSRLERLTEKAAHNYLPIYKYSEVVFGYCWHIGDKNFGELDLNELHHYLSQTKFRNARLEESKRYLLTEIHYLNDEGYKEYNRINFELEQGELWVDVLTREIDSRERHKKVRHSNVSEFEKSARKGKGVTVLHRATGETKKFKSYTAAANFTKVDYKTLARFLLKTGSYATDKYVFRKLYE